MLTRESSGVEADVADVDSHICKDHDLGCPHDIVKVPKGTVTHSPQTERRHSHDRT